MRIIIDSNVLFSAIIKDSITRKMILEYDGLFLFPEFIFKEISKHQEELCAKSRMGEQEFCQLLQIILEKVEIVPEKALIPYKNESLELVADIDPDDAPFIACALAYLGSILWSNDRRLKRIKQVNVRGNSELMRIFYPSEAMMAALISEKSLAKIWLTKEEDEAWKNL